MYSDHDVTRIVRTWLRTDEHESADRVLHDVLALLDHNTQRRSWGRAGRIIDMNALARFAVAAAALMVVAVIGINLLPASVPSASPLPSPSASPSASPSPSPRPSPTPWPTVVRGVGEVAIGRTSLTVGGVPLSFSMSASGWYMYGSLYISKSSVENDVPEAIIYWTTFPDAAYTNPCGPLLGSSVGESAADLAAVLSTLPGTERVTGPSDVTVGGRPAKRVVIAVQDEGVGCNPGFLFFWHGGRGGPFWRGTIVGDWVRAWILDVDGVRLFIVAETHADAGREIDQEIEQIIDSIRFE